MTKRMRQMSDQLLAPSCDNTVFIINSKILIYHSPTGSNEKNISIFMLHISQLMFSLSTIYCTCVARSFFMEIN